MAGNITAMKHKVVTFVLTFYNALVSQEYSRDINLFNLKKNTATIYIWGSQNRLESIEVCDYGLNSLQDTFPAVECEIVIQRSAIITTL